MSSDAVQLFLSVMGEIKPAADGEAPPAFASDDPDRQARADWFRADLLEVLGSSDQVALWDPEEASIDEVFATFVHIAEAYFHAVDEGTRAFLRKVMENTAALAEDPQYIRAMLPIVAMNPGERWELLGHGALVNEVCKEANEVQWPVRKKQIVATAERLNDPEIDKKLGAPFHVKHLKDMGLVKVSKKARLQDQMTNTARDMWLFVKLTDEAPRFIALLGYK